MGECDVFESTFSTLRDFISSVKDHQFVDEAELHIHVTQTRSPKDVVQFVKAVSLLLQSIKRNLSSHNKKLKQNNHEGSSGNSGETPASYTNAETKSIVPVECIRYPIKEKCSNCHLSTLTSNVSVDKTVEQHQNSTINYNDLQSNQHENYQYVLKHKSEDLVQQTSSTNQFTIVPNEANTATFLSQPLSNPILQPPPVHMNPIYVTNYNFLSMPPVPINTNPSLSTGCTNIPVDYGKQTTTLSQSCAILNNGSSETFNSDAKNISTEYKPNQQESNSDDSIQVSSDDSNSTTNGNLSKKMPVFCCRQCFLTYLNLETFNNHICKKLEGFAELNPDCTDYEKYKIIISDNDELAKHHKFICGLCLEEFRSLNRIVHHIHKCSPGPYNCPCCALVFSTRNALNNHLKSQHANEKCYVCSECSKSFKYKSSLQKHLVSHHETKSSVGPFNCDLCSKFFIKKIYLTNHKLRAHAIKKGFSCKVCSNKFLNEVTMNTHYRIVHGDLKDKWVCSFCARPFSRKDKLINHEAMHTGVRPFSCSLCNKSYACRSKLNQHIFRNHQPENMRRRYLCDCCEKNYANRTDLKNHVRRVHGKDVNDTRVLVGYVVQGKVLKQTAS